MVERAARAFSSAFLVVSWEEVDETVRERILEAARVGIGAMREPTRHMAGTGRAQLAGSGNIVELRADLAVWRVMIDAALAEHP